jgi:D-serine deaminase-like pyridoxal phosphate-dependent protein
MTIHDLDTPALIVDLDILERNIETMAEHARAGGKALRPHIKTHKCPDIALIQETAGAQGITVAKLGEAEVFAENGFGDIFIANQIIGAAKMKRLATLAKRCWISVGVDNKDAVNDLAFAVVEAGLTLRALIEVDTGTGRAGVRTVEQATQLAQMIDRFPGIEFGGIYTHEAAYQPDPVEREACCLQAVNKMTEIKAAIEALGIEVATVSVGSTPGAPIMAKHPVVTELRPGNYVFLDAMQTHVAARVEDCALRVLATVTSRPEPHIAIIDAGTKSLSGDKALEGSRHGIVLDDPAIIFDWANEEHGHLDLTNATLNPKIGDKLTIIPWHGCTCCNMHQKLYAVREAKVEHTWEIAARGRFT